jgi:hypothetical protein
LIAYNKRKKTIVKKNQRKKRIDLDNTVICTIEETVIDTKRQNLTKLLSARIAITHALWIKLNQKL